jgi:truncated hemoglobin YjbI
MTMKKYQGGFKRITKEEFDNPRVKRQISVTRITKEEFDNAGKKK